ncbi:unnamed protein product [Linum tenue]|uniref:Uncharacterized protein n=1 Tax=Linum tenue TaxID=586396 RepID=A0AAV0NEL4_9ROSI|nr:unnamed protein product [Linum tenue]
MSTFLHPCRHTEEKPGWCKEPYWPPCAAFVEIMAPVFSREAWRCVWHMIQNDLVHGWGLDFTMRKCIEVWNIRERESAMGRGEEEVSNRMEDVL